MKDYDESYFQQHISGWHRDTYEPIAKFLFDKAGSTKLPRVLDFGCGDGIYGHALRKVAVTLIGADVSADAVQTARQAGAYDGVLQVDLGRQESEESLQAAGPFDLVFTTEVIEHIHDFEAALQLCRACMQPGGRLLLTTTMYYHLFFHALLADRRALSGGGFRDFLRGLWVFEKRSTFVRRLWNYTGGHYHGFGRRPLKAALSRAGFNVESFGWLYAGQVVPTFMLSQDRERFAKRGLACQIAANVALAGAKTINWGVRALRLPGPNCLIVACAR